MAEDDDSRLSGQDETLKGVKLSWKRYRAWSKTWEHDHCAFCWAKFMDPAFSEEHRRFIEEHPDVLTEGYATTAEHPRGAEYEWICKPCFDDFAERFAFVVVPDVQDLWRERRGPDVDGVLLGNGTLHVMKLAGMEWRFVRTVDASSADRWIDLDAQNASADDAGRRALCGEASAHGSIGWVALTHRTSGRLDWLVVSSWSNPFDAVRFDGDILVARSTARTAWHIPLGDPRSVRIERAAL